MPKPNFAGATIRAGHNLEVMRGVSSACVDLGAAPPPWMRHPVGLIRAICPTPHTQPHRLYGEQEGVCAGCTLHFPFRVMEVDHILPRCRDGTDHPDNLLLPISP